MNQQMKACIDRQLNDSNHILYNVLYTFPLLLTRRICLTIKASKAGDHFFILNILINNSAVLL